MSIASVDETSGDPVLFKLVKRYSQHCIYRTRGQYNCTVPDALSRKQGGITAAKSLLPWVSTNRSIEHQ